MRKAKIICTLGPASSSRPILESMIRAGMDVARARELMGERTRPIIAKMRVKRVHSTDAMIRQVRSLCREERLCPVGRPVVIVTGVPLNHPGKTNMMTVHRI